MGFGVWGLGFGVWGLGFGCMVVHSPQLASMILGAFRVDEMTGVYRVLLRPNGVGVRWTAVDADTTEELDIDPDTSVWQRVRLMLLSWFIPESQL